MLDEFARFHHTLSTILNGLLSNGFWLLGIEEKINDEPIQHREQGSIKSR